MELLNYEKNYNQSRKIRALLKDSEVKNIVDLLIDLKKDLKQTTGSIKYQYLMKYPDIINKVNNKLYLNKSQYLKQNIFPVCQFLIKGYSIEEAEKLAKLLPDANKLTVFCYEKKEKGYLYNKLFMDLRFVYLQYDEYIKNGCDKGRAFEIVKEDIEK